MDAVLANAAKLETIATEKGAQYFCLSARPRRIIPSGVFGEASAAIEPLSQITKLRRKRHELLNLPALLASLTNLQVIALKCENAVATIEDAHAFVEQTGERQIVASPHPLLGEALMQSDPQAAEGAFAEAVAFARRQGARTFELQAALALARLYLGNRRASEAYDDLAAALDEFVPTLQLGVFSDTQALLAKPAVRVGTPQQSLRSEVKDRRDLT